MVVPSLLSFTSLVFNAAFGVTFFPPVSRKIQFKCDDSNKSLPILKSLRYGLILK